MSQPLFTEWAVLELMDHRKVGGKVSEQTIAGGMLRIDIPGDESDEWTVQLYTLSAVYCITTVSEQTARRFELARRFHRRRFHDPDDDDEIPF